MSSLKHGFPADMKSSFSAWVYVLYVGFFLLSHHTGFGQIRLPRLVSDGMVLQRETPVNIWGWAKSGEKVRLTFNG